MIKPTVSPLPQSRQETCPLPVFCTVTGQLVVTFSRPSIDETDNVT